MNLGSGAATQKWHLYANLFITNPFRGLPAVALQTVTMQAAVQIGMAQGELQGCISNLQTVCRIVAPLLWSNLYSWGSSHGLPSVCFVQFLLCATNDLNVVSPSRPDEPVAGAAAA